MVDGVLMEHREEEGGDGKQTPETASGRHNIEAKCPILAINKRNTDII